VILPYEVYLSKQAKNPPDTPVDTKTEPSDDPVTHEKQPSPSTSTSTSSSASKAAVGTRKSKRIKKDPVSYAGKQNQPLFLTVMIVDVIEELFFLILINHFDTPRL
jgi:hypothetical protein